MYSRRGALRYWREEWDKNDKCRDLWRREKKRLEFKQKIDSAMHVKQRSFYGEPEYFFPFLCSPKKCEKLPWRGPGRREGRACITAPWIGQKGHNLSGNSTLGQSLRQWDAGTGHSASARV